MERRPKALTDAVRLLQLTDLLTSSVRSVIEEWAKEDSVKDASAHGRSGGGSPVTLPSHKLYQAQRVILSVVGAFTELCSEPSSRVTEVACQYWESRALYIAAERRIPDLLAATTEVGLSAKELGEATGIEHLKLSRILRCLCSIHIFHEVSPDCFANNIVSAALVNNEPLRAYVLLFNLDLYTASDHLPRYLLSAKGASYDVNETAFQDAVGTTKPRWEWLEEKVYPSSPSSQGIGYPGPPDGLNGAIKNSNGEAISRPEHNIFGLAMLGGGKVFGAAHPYDYPWDALAEAVVVDVGGGVGGFDIQLSKLYPNLKFVVQDRGATLQQAEKVVWPAENPIALSEGRVTFMEHDFFQPNPVHGAAVYWLRYILHDWSDDYCISILSAIRPSMTIISRILICDQVMNTTYGCAELEPSPSPLPANYGYYTRYSHQRDLAMMGIINGIERTPAQFKRIVEAAGLRLERIWECRSQVSIVEVRRDE